MLNSEIILDEWILNVPLLTHTHTHTAVCVSILALCITVKIKGHQVLELLSDVMRGKPRGLHLVPPFSAIEKNVTLKQKQIIKIVTKNQEIISICFAGIWSTSTRMSVKSGDWAPLASFRQLLTATAAKAEGRVMAQPSWTALLWEAKAFCPHQRYRCPTYPFLLTTVARSPRFLWSRKVRDNSKV